ncbi:MAG: hypothetical protein MSG64_15140 [Pyrinomonadaceae bacterium MAG19_C2-C3]|nr:hypothetical protein [Pyrinomonadaceae bacterium MAG19_C2-C3]
MNYRLFAKSFCGGAALLFALHLAAAVSNDGYAIARVAGQHEQSDEGDFNEKEEIRRSYRLAPGARVEVSGINGGVKIETADTDTAEVYIVRSARRREDLNFRRINVEQTATSLSVRGERAREEPNVKVRQRVVLRLPRRVELLTESINGGVRIGEIDGPVKLRSINGGVEVVRASLYTEISSINGGVTMTIARLGERGVRVTHVNGGIKLRFTEDLNADLDVTHLNGGVSAEMPNVTVLSREKHSEYRARIGSGGIPITIAHVNGGISLSRSA